MNTANQNKILLNLLVIRTKDIHELSAFYSLLGIEFDYHKHEAGIFHYSAEIGDLIFEIYPLRENEIAEKNIRLGFKIENLIDTVEVLRSQNHKIVSYPKVTKYGLTAVIEDLDGRKVELTEK